MMGDEAAGMHKDNYVALIVVTVCLIVFLVRFVSYYTHMIRDKVSQVEVSYGHPSLQSIDHLFKKVTIVQ